MLPPASTPQLFTGQCNDAFFQYARQASLSTFLRPPLDFSKGFSVDPLLPQALLFVSEVLLGFESLLCKCLAGHVSQKTASNMQRVI